MTYEGVPGLVETREAHGETTLVVDPARLVEACTYLRDEHGFNFLSDIAATDYLGWPESTSQVAGYVGTASGRNINVPASQGLQRLPEGRPKRFAMNYQLLAVREGAPRLRVQVWLEDGESVPTVIGVWPTADWFEREAWDMMGIPIEGHPNLSRLLMDEDWEGHPLRKDYPLGGEPVRFSSEE
ncbi:MAG: NADH-quinone oxidoreductase subunit C [Actinobacteria bacterium]|nr:NADH-quinone oxidoreductase subunit C [Actinomycetota bacterium]